VVLERTVRELRGEPCLDLEEFAPAKQEIVCSRSFGERVTEYEQMRQAICSYAARAPKSFVASTSIAGLSPVRENLSLCA
jgi:nucleotidyltransferase/DNA polymerase involved in DNA repair